MGIGMIYVVGKIFPLRVKFYTQYNELAHENKKHLESFFSEKNINLLKIEMEVHETALYRYTHIYISCRIHIIR